jgi:hypothetical protein
MCPAAQLALALDWEKRACHSLVISPAIRDYCYLPAGAQAALLSAHLNANQYQIVMGTIVRNQIQSSNKKSVLTQAGACGNEAQGMQYSVNSTLA